MNTVKNILKFGIILYFSYVAGQIVAGPFSIYLKIAILILPIIAILLLLNPIWGFMILLFLRPLVDPLRDYYLMGGVNFLGVFSFINVLFAFYVLIRAQDVKLLTKNIRWFYIYIIIAILSIVNSSDIFISFITLMKLLSLLALFLLAYNLPKSLEDTLKIIKAILISAIIPILYGLFQLIAGQGVQTPISGPLAGISRLQSTFRLSNGFAFYLGIIILLSILMQFYSHKIKATAFSLLIIVGASICMLYTYTRGIWISILLSLGCIAVFKKNYRRWLIILALICIPLFYDEVLKRFDDIINPPKYGISSFVFRLEITKQLLSNAVPEHFFLGFGLGLSDKVADEYTDFSLLPHNDYIRVLVETGILGAITYLIFFSKMFFYLLTLVRKKVNLHANTVFMGILTYYLIASMGQNSFTHISASGYIFALMGLAQKMNDISEISTGGKNGVL